MNDLISIDKRSIKIKISTIYQVQNNKYINKFVLINLIIVYVRLYPRHE